ncbi:MAG: undecaprenyl-diphosphate phosphatase [Candidatus Aminicenantes bacterium]|nr:undecaprenyl-diphosphate phosphatase [Candidatus Aminicenantes bacterium]
MPLALKVFLLAVVQGLTEFFPVSSSGHLLVFQKLLDFTTLPLVYDIFFHLGTLLAVVVYFSRDLRSLVLRFRERENARLLLMIALASLPTALIGFFFRGFFESLFEQTSHLGLAFLFSAALLLGSRYLRRQREMPGLPAALLIGIAQGLAIAPGVSRSGMTIAVALLLGLGFEYSFRLSFLLSIPAILGAALLEAGKIPWQGGHWPHLLLAIAVSAVVGILALGALRRIVIREKFHLFALYLVPLGLLALMFL